MATSTETTAQGIRYRKLVHSTNNTRSGPASYYTLVSHSEIDGLIGRLMQMCDLIGDVEQRKALKDTIKKLTRDWLDDLYTDSGYDKWDGPRPEALIIED